MKPAAIAFLAACLVALTTMPANAGKYSARTITSTTSGSGTTTTRFSNSRTVCKTSTFSGTTKTVCR
jgi:hypothetical protein